ncbi:phosphohydrolase [Burkholderia thailandensis]|nr:phosphohydrolase [Burkholderia thailandensis]MDD1486289.1 phosphohydrolase [Burkholderia thailandensis]MDD1492065.1 phosphohydrolase [Burkholderia thailandensis]
MPPCTAGGCARSAAAFAGAPPASGLPKVLKMRVIRDFRAASHGDVPAIRPDAHRDKRA